MRSGFPDHVYLKRGDVWRGQSINAVQSGRSKSEPSVIAFYGDSGKRPRIEHSDPVFKVNGSKNAKQHLNIIGLHFYAYKLDPENPAFTGSHDDDASISMLSGNKDILFEDNVFDLLEVVFQDWDGQDPEDFTFRRNIWTGAYNNNTSLNRNARPSNLFANDTNGLLIEENVFDYGGWNPNVKNAGANMYNHNLYIQYDNVGNSIVIRNNIITRASSHGIHGRPGGLYQNNFFARNSISLGMGYKDHPLSKGTFARAIDNVITEGRSMVKGDNACAGTNLCTPAVWGLVTSDHGEGDFYAENNIIHSLAPNDSEWQKFFGALKYSPISMGGAPSINNQVAMWPDQKTSNTLRTLADYNEHIGGDHDFDEFMDEVRTRPMQTWDVRYTADAINKFIREGF